MAFVMDKELKKCSICNKKMKNVYSLICQHTTCNSCLTKWKLLNPYKFVCPVCRAGTLCTFLLNPESVHKKLAGVVEQLQVPPCDVCSGSFQAPRPKKASSFCRNCQGCMCYKCAEAHIRFPSFEFHKLISIQDLKNNDEFCQEHQRKSKDFYCKECDILLCHMCATKEHQQHLKSVHNASEYCKGFVKEVVNLMEKAGNIYDFQHNLKYRDRLLRLKEIEKSIADMKSTVKDHVKTIIKDIKAQESKLLASIDANTGTLKKWQDWAEGTKALKPHAEKLLKNCETYFKTKKPADLLIGTKDLYAEVNRGVAKYGWDAPLLEVPVDFIPEPQAQLSIGRVALKGEQYIKSENTSSCDCDSDYAPSQKKPRVAHTEEKPKTIQRIIISKGRVLYTK